MVLISVFHPKKPRHSGACRLDMLQPKLASPMASSDRAASGPKRLAKMDVDALAKYFSHPCSNQQAALSEAQPDIPIVATPREFLKAAMRARQSFQHLQVSCDPIFLMAGCGCASGCETRQRNVMF